MLDISSSYNPPSFVRRYESIPKILVAQNQVEERILKESSTLTSVWKVSMIGMAEMTQTMLQSPSNQMSVSKELDLTDQQTLFRNCENIDPLLFDVDLHHRDQAIPFLGWNHLNMRNSVEVRSPAPETETNQDLDGADRTS